MQDYVASLMESVRAKNPAEPEFHQAVQEVAESLVLVRRLFQADCATVVLASSKFSQYCSASISS